MQKVVSRGFVSLLLVLVFALSACAGSVHIGKAEYEYYAPQIHEMYLKLPVTVDPGGKEAFYPNAVQIDGKRAPYIYFYFNGTTVDFAPIPNASKGKIELFVPVHWRGNEQHEVALQYSLNGENGEEKATLPTPKTGGAWTEASDNIAFMVREEAGLARRNEPVDFDLTVEQDRFPDPEKRIRATVMTAPGVFVEIPCQVYDVQPVTQEHGMYSKIPLFRFRAVVQLAMKPKSQTLVHLWSCQPRETPAAGPVTLEGGALGGTVSNDAYQIKLDETCGQFHTWYDKRLKVQFEYKDTRPGVTGQQAVIHRTPDLYRANKSWTHALDWKAPENRVITGPVMVETIRWGEMPWVPEAFSKVDYRFFANRPEIRAISSMRVTKDIEALGVRMGGFILTPDLFTDIAWPDQSGAIHRCTVPDALGNDMGAPPQSRFPVNTPWVVVYHKEKKYGFALITAKYAYFSDGPGHANESRQQAYISNYRGYGVYAIRSATQTYCAWFRSYHTPIEAGTTMYEDVAYLPFVFTREDKHQFDPVWALWKEMTNPLVIEP